MPQVQILSRQEDPTARLIQQAGSDIAKTIQERQAMELTLKEIKLKQKMSDNEMEKARLENLHKITDYMFKLKENGATPDQIMGFSKEHFGESVIPNMGEAGAIYRKMFEFAANAPGTGEREARQAKTGLDTAQMEQVQEQTKIMKDPAGYASRLSALNTAGGVAGGHGMQMTGMKVGDMNFENLDATVAKTTAVEEAKMAEDVKATGAMYDEYKTAVDALIKGVGPSKSPGEAGLKGALIWAKSAGDPNAKTVTKLREPLALSLAAIMNKRAPTEPDKQAAKEALMREDLPTATNEILDRGVRAILRLPKPTTDEEAQANKDKVEALKNLATNDARFRDAAKKRGTSDADIEAALEKIHARLGF